ncbi:hypothetical protein [Streptomyces showdoensis]|uniref:hypothetical protein n=1 Tax=Streptomyces showdoensis TaxID=68268 RepID=UPI0010402241|nr:hypothetical protein [Streptomyces showdoensis]
MAVIRAGTAGSSAGLPPEVSVDHLDPAGRRAAARRADGHLDREVTAEHRILGVVPRQPVHADHASGDHLGPGLLYRP